MRGASAAMSAGGKAGGGISDAFARAKPDVKPLMLAAEPTALVALAAGTGDLAAAAKTVVDDLTWPGKPVPPAPKNTRTPEEGQAVLPWARWPMKPTAPAATRRAAKARARIAPALAGSQIVLGRADMSLRVLLNGKDGKIGEMPPLGQSLSDNQLAGVLDVYPRQFRQHRDTDSSGAGQGIPPALCLPQEALDRCGAAEAAALMVLQVARIDQALRRGGRRWRMCR